MGFVPPEKISLGGPGCVHEQRSLNMKKTLHSSLSQT